MEARIPRKTLGCVGKKVLMDQFIRSPGMLVIFFVGNSVLAKEKDLFANLRSYFLPTILVSIFVHVLL
jgi:hypothetical protein